MSFSKVDANGPQPQLRHVESYSEAGVAVERPIGWISRDSIGVRIEQRVGSSNSIIELIDEDRQRYPAVEGHRLAEFDLEAEPTKTRLLRFGDQARARCKQEGLSRPQTFTFLVHPTFLWVKADGYRSRPPQWK